MFKTLDQAMRRQRFGHTFCSEEDLSFQSDAIEESPLAQNEIFYLPPLPIEQNPVQWNQYNNLELQGSSSSSAFFSLEPQQQQYQRSFSNISSSNNNSFFSISAYNSLNTQFEDTYGNQSYAPSAFNIEYESGGVGDSPVPSATPDVAGMSESYDEDHDNGQYEDSGAYSHLPVTVPFQTYPALSNVGTVFLVLRHCVRVDLTSAKAIFVANYPGGCVGGFNDIGDHCGIIHPNGKVLQEVSAVHMETGNKKAKFCKRGVVFTSTNHSLSYLVDASGTKSTSDKFKDMSYDFVSSIFFGTSISKHQEQSSLNVCCRLISESSYQRYNNGDEVWIIGGVRIKQNSWGEVRISANYNRRVLRTSPTINSMSISTPSVSMRISCHPYHHFIVKRGNRTVCAGTHGMSAQNGSQKAGFDCTGKLTLL